MKLIASNTKAGAVGLNAKALAFAISEQGASGSEWSKVFTNGTRFAITYDDSIEAAFSDAELLGIVEGDRVRVIDGEKVGEWEVAS